MAPEPPPWPSAPDRPDRAVAPLYCTDGPLLCRVQVWTEQEWAALDSAGRPARAERVEGLGWVAAVPIESLN